MRKGKQVNLQDIKSCTHGLTMPYWLGGMNILNLRDASVVDIQNNDEYCEQVCLMLREAHACGYILWDPIHCMWAPNPQFSDYNNWMAGWPNLRKVLIILTEVLEKNKNNCGNTDSYEESKPDSF